MQTDDMIDTFGLVWPDDRCRMADVDDGQLSDGAWPWSLVGVKPAKSASTDACKLMHNCK